MSFAEVNGIKICYEIHGDGYPVILVEGYGAKKEEWIAQIGPLSEHFKIITLDNRGSGKSDRPNYPYTMEMFADDIKGLMDFLGLKKAHIVGKSLGGMIVQIFALKYPQYVNKLVLLNTSTGYPSDQGPEMFKQGKIDNYYAKLKDPFKTFFESARGGYSRKFRKLMQKDPKRKFHGLWSAEDLIKESTIDPTTPQDIENQANGLKGFDSLEKLREIKSETLILGAEKDRVMSVYNQQQMHERIPDSTIKIIKDAGHGSNLEKAPEVNQILIDFLRN